MDFQFVLHEYYEFIWISFHVWYCIVRAPRPAAQGRLDDVDLLQLLLRASLPSVVSVFGSWSFCFTATSLCIFLASLLALLSLLFLLFFLSFLVTSASASACAPGFAPMLLSESSCASLSGPASASGAQMLRTARSMSRALQLGISPVTFRRNHLPWLRWLRRRGSQLSHLRPFGHFGHFGHFPFFPFGSFGSFSHSQRCHVFDGFLGIRRNGNVILPLCCLHLLHPARIPSKPHQLSPHKWMISRFDVRDEFKSISNTGVYQSLS